MENEEKKKEQMSFSIFEGKISGILEICVKISNHLQEIESEQPWKAMTKLHQFLPIGRSSNRDKSYFVDLSLIYCNRIYFMF